VNKIEADILLDIYKNGYSNQRAIVERTGYSLGSANKSIKTLNEQGYLDSDNVPTDKAVELIRKNSPKSAVILAAGSGMRMVPINTVTSKGLLTVKGKTLVEHLLDQLVEAGIRDISIVVGFLKEKYEYLIDDYNVKLIVNNDYSSRNNLHSLALAAGRISNTYVVPCDIYCDENPFSDAEILSWYMMKNDSDPKSSWRVNRKLYIETTRRSEIGNKMVGIAYLNSDYSEKIKDRLRKLDSDKEYEGEFWEASIRREDSRELSAKVVPSDKVYEVNTYEQLRDLDRHSYHLDTEPIKVAAEVFGVSTDKIRNIRALKKGMTNRSFMFEYNDKRYIMRVPGEGTDKLINRREEAEVYGIIRGKGLCDDVVYINPDNGYKITEYIENVRNADPANPEDVRMCMTKLREFHNLKLKVGHDFDIFGQIEFYEELWDGESSVYRDYDLVKKNILSLRSYIDENAGEKSLTHIDAIPDNFLIHPGKDGKENIQLTDWEYSGMQDPHVDLAMYSIYSYYDKGQVDELIDIYFENNCPIRTRIKIYCYVAVCGFLWSNWCEYKRNLGVEFGEYSLKQYRYAKEFYVYARAAMEKLG